MKKIVASRDWTDGDGMITTSAMVDNVPFERKRATYVELCV